MNPKGIVVEIKNNTALVELQEVEECKGCEFYRFCSIGKGERRIVCLNKRGAKIGDIVEVNTTGKNILFASMFNFLFPILILIIGIILCVRIFESEIIGLLIAALLVILYFLVFRFIDRKIIKSGKIIPQIVNIKKKGE